MQTIKKKLHSNSGASMIMALLLMLVGVVTSAVIIAASLSAALHIKEDRAQQQAYLTVSSAAELIRDQLEAGKSNYKKKVTITYKQSKDKKKEWVVSDESTETSSGDGIFSSIIESAMDYLKTGTAGSYHETYIIHADSQNTDYDDVSAEVFVKKTVEETNDEQKDKYSLEVWFSGGKEPNQCRLILTMNSNITTETTEGSSDNRKTKYKVNTTTVTWQDSSIQRPRIQ